MRIVVACHPCQKVNDQDFRWDCTLIVIANRSSLCSSKANLGICLSFVGAFATFPVKNKQIIAVYFPVVDHSVKPLSSLVPSVKLIDIQWRWRKASWITWEARLGSASSKSGSGDDSIIHSSCTPSCICSTVPLVTRDGAEATWRTVFHGFDVPGRFANEAWGWWHWPVSAMVPVGVVCGGVLHVVLFTWHHMSQTSPNFKHEEHREFQPCCTRWLSTP